MTVFWFDNCIFYVVEHSNGDRVEVDWLLGGN